MPEPAGFQLLEEKTKLLLDVLLQIHFQCQKQRALFEKASPEDIKDFTELKSQRLHNFQTLLGEIQSIAGELRSAAGDSAALDAMLAECEKQSRPLIDEIISIETNDKIILDKLKVAMSTEIDEVKKARAKIVTLKGAYGPAKKDRTLFDKRT